MWSSTLIYSRYTNRKNLGCSSFLFLFLLWNELFQMHTEHVCRTDVRGPVSGMRWRSYHLPGVLEPRTDDTRNGAGVSSPWDDPSLWGARFEKSLDFDEQEEAGEEPGLCGPDCFLALHPAPFCTLSLPTNEVTSSSYSWTRSPIAYPFPSLVYTYTVHQPCTQIANHLYSVLTPCSQAPLSLRTYEMTSSGYGQISGNLLFFYLPLLPTNLVPRLLATYTTTTTTPYSVPTSYSQAPLFFHTFVMTPSASGISWARSPAAFLFFLYLPIYRFLSEW